MPWKSKKYTKVLYFYLKLEIIDLDITLIIKQKVWFIILIAIRMQSKSVLNLKSFGNKIKNLNDQF